MAFWNRKPRKDEDTLTLNLGDEQEAEQLRLGKILYETLKPIAKNNDQVQGGRISAGYLESNAGKYSVVLTYRSPGHSESMLQFNIDLANNKLSGGTKWHKGAEFTADQFDQFLEAACTTVRDFR